jgi:GPN-loop GTPase
LHTFLFLFDIVGIGRQVAVVNLDPANDGFAYDCKIDIAELIQLSEVMDYLHLGPNGGLVYCMEYLEQNADWLQQKLQSLAKETYILFDCPGQVELYTHNKAVRGLFAKLSKAGYRLAAVHLADAHYCADPGKFVSVLLTSLSAMLQVSVTIVDLTVC